MNKYSINGASNENFFCKRIILQIIYKKKVYSIIASARLYEAVSYILWTYIAIF